MPPYPVKSPCSPVFRALTLQMRGNSPGKLSHGTRYRSSLILPGYPPNPQIVSHSHPMPTALETYGEYRLQGGCTMRRLNQFERTDRDITNAFLSLLETKSFEKITVDDIIDAAMVNRSTFYQHFQDKYAILEMLQKKYVTELTNIVQEIQLQNRSDLKEMDRIFDSYFLKNRRTLRNLLHIKTEHVDIAKQLRSLFTNYFLKNSDALSELEAYLMSGLLLDFFLYCLEHDMAAENYSTLLFESYYKMSLHFFQLEQNPDAQREFLNLLDNYAGK